MTPPESINLLVLPAHGSNSDKMFEPVEVVDGVGGGGEVALRVHHVHQTLSRGGFTYDIHKFNVPMLKHSSLSCHNSHSFHLTYGNPMWTSYENTSLGQGRHASVGVQLDGGGGRGHGAHFAILSPALRVI